jgi:hypothetical protein
MTKTGALVIVAAALIVAAAFGEAIAQGFCPPGYVPVGNGACCPVGTIPVMGPNGAMQCQRM